MPEAGDIVQTITLEGQDEVASGFDQIGKAGETAFKRLSAAAGEMGQALTSNVADFFGAIHEQIAAARKAQEELGKAAGGGGGGGGSRGPGGFLQGFLGGLTVEGLHQIEHAITGAVEAVGHMAESMQHLSTSTGVSVEDLSSLQGVLAGSGLSADKFAASFKKMNESAVEDTMRVRRAVQHRAEAERDAGLSVERAHLRLRELQTGERDVEAERALQRKEAANELTKAMERQRELQQVSPVQKHVERITEAAAGLTGIERENKLVDMLREIPDAAERAGASVQTLKRELTTLEFEKGSAGVEALRQRAIELGAVLTETETRDLNKFREGLAATGQSITVLAGKFVAGMLKPFTGELEENSRALDNFAKSAAAAGEAFGKMLHQLGESGKKLRDDPSLKTLTDFMIGKPGESLFRPSDRQIIDRMRRQQGLEPLPPTAEERKEEEERRKAAEPEKKKFDPSRPQIKDEPFTTAPGPGYWVRDKQGRLVPEKGTEEGVPQFKTEAAPTPAEVKPAEVKPAEVKPAEVIAPAETPAAAPAKEAADSLEKIPEPASLTAEALSRLGSAIDGAIEKLGELLGVPRPEPAPAPAPAASTPAPAAESSKAAGGAVGGWGGPKSDSVPIMASKGEFVVRADGSNLHDAIAFFTGAKGYQEGGSVDGGAGSPGIGGPPTGFVAWHVPRSGKEMQQQWNAQAAADKAKRDWIRKRDEDAARAGAQARKEAAAERRRPGSQTQMELAASVVPGMDPSQLAEVKSQLGLAEGGVVGYQGGGPVGKSEREKREEQARKEAEAEAKKRAEEERRRAEEIAKAYAKRRATVVGKLEQVAGRDPETGQLNIAGYDPSNVFQAWHSTPGPILGMAGMMAEGGVVRLLQGFANGGLVGGFARSVAHLPGYAAGGRVTASAPASNTLSFHQLDLRTSAGTFSAGVSGETMEALRSSSLAGKLSQTGERPSWYS